MQYTHNFEADYDDIAHICRITQGLPLALELAASQFNALSIGTIAEQLNKVLNPSPDRSPPDIVERHRNMRSVFEWSWQLLSKDERRIVMQLSVFRGGWTLDAAQKIIAITLAEITALVNKSFIQKQANGRYSIHPLLHQFAEQYLRENPDLYDQVHHQHCHYYTGLVVKQAEKLYGIDLLQGTQTIHSDINNIWSAWDWAVEKARIDDLFPLIFPLNIYRLMFLLPAMYARITKTIDDLRSMPQTQIVKLTLARFLYCHHGVFTPTQRDIHNVAQSLQESRELLEDLGVIHLNLTICTVS